MSELAYNITGEAFEVPANATGWLVRKMRAKGSPEVVYGRDGLPLALPISAELDDLKSEVDVSGRYCLDLIDRGASDHYIRDIVVFQMLQKSLHVVHFKRAPNALMNCAGPHHQVLDEKLAPPAE